MEKKLKIGIIGLGKIAGFHINSYLKIPNVEIYAICDINPKRLEIVAKEHNISRVFTDMNEMLKLDEIDAVSICTWNSEHAPCAIAALNAGKHVLCEKPMAICSKDAILMKEAADKNNKLLMIGFVRRFSDECNMLNELISTDYLGEIYYAKATYLRRKGNPGGWFGDKSRSGGGPLIDLGVHVIDLVRYLSGNPKPISAYGVTYQKLFDRKNIKKYEQYVSVGKTSHDICDVEDLASAIIRFDNGLSLAIETSFSLNRKGNETSTQLFGTKGGAKLNDLEGSLELYSEVNDYMVDVTPVLTTKTSFVDIFEKEVQHFVDCIINNTKCKAPAEDGVEIMRILDAVYESARTGNEIKL